MLRDWGAEKKYQHVLKGYNFRLEGIQGAVLRVKLRHLETLDRGAPRGGRALRPRCSPAAACRTPEALAHDRHVYHIYAIRTAHAPGLAGRAADAGHPDRHPLPDPGAPAAGVCRPRLPGGTVPALRAGRERGAVAADVPGADGAAVRGRSAAVVKALAGREARRGLQADDYDAMPVAPAAAADLSMQRQRARGARLPRRARSAASASSTTRRKSRAPSACGHRVLPPLGACDDMPEAAVLAVPGSPASYRRRAARVIEGLGVAARAVRDV